MRSPRDLGAAVARGTAAGMGVVLLTALLIAGIVRLLGGDPTRALLAVQSGALGSPAAVAETLIKTAPLVMTGLSVALAFRCGIWNIGAEGQFLAGMLGAMAVGLWLPPRTPVLTVTACLLAATAAGALWALVPALLKVRRDVPEVISTIMLNFLAVYAIEYLVRGPMHDPTSSNDWSPHLPDAVSLPPLTSLFGWSHWGGDAVRLPDGRPILALGVDVGRLHLGVLFALAAAPLAWAWLSRSGLGFRIRAIGLNRAAAATAGIAVDRVVLATFLLSGALAGLGGGLEILGLIQRMYRYQPGEPGYGLSGIAVALLGRLHPMGVLVAALFFGGLTAGCNQMQRSAGVSYYVAYVIQGAVVLLLISLPRLPRRWWRPGNRKSGAGSGGRNG